MCVNSRFPSAKSWKLNGGAFCLSPDSASFTLWLMGKFSDKFGIRITFASGRWWRQQTLSATGNQRQE
ncbi:hypothetical protein EJP617_17930 [Erwinia sp. Ejp617]|nr:hypothetical protein EJP617_17930 [Erwinia sp. Ejp617]